MDARYLLRVIGSLIGFMALLVFLTAALMTLLYPDPPDSPFAPYNEFVPGASESAVGHYYCERAPVPYIDNCFVTIARPPVWAISLTFEAGRITHVTFQLRQVRYGDLVSAFGRPDHVQRLLTGRNYSGALLLCWDGGRTARVLVTGVATLQSRATSMSLRQAVECGR